MVGSGVGVGSLGVGVGERTERTNLNLCLLRAAVLVRNVNRQLRLLAVSRRRNCRIRFYSRHIWRIDRQLNRAVVVPRRSLTDTSSRPSAPSLTITVAFLLL